MTIDDYMRMSYRTEVYVDETAEQPCCMAYNPELPGCMAQGSTAQEAVDNLKEARRDYIEAMLKHGLDVNLPEKWSPSPALFKAHPISILNQREGKPMPDASEYKAELVVA